MPDDMACLFIPFGNPVRGVAGFVGGTRLWERFQSNKSTAITALDLIQKPKHSDRKADDPSVLLLRSKTPVDAATVCANYLARLLDAKRVSIFHRESGRWKLLACSGVKKIDFHSPEVHRIQKRFHSLLEGGGVEGCVGGALSAWCGQSEAENTGIVVESASTDRDLEEILRAEAPLVAHAMESKRGPLRALLFPNRAARGKNPGSILRYWWVVAMVLLLLVLVRPVPVSISGPCELMPKHRSLVVARVGGKISSVLVREGEEVQNGQALFQIDATALLAAQAVKDQTLKQLENDARRWMHSGEMKNLRDAEIQHEQLVAELNLLARDIENATICSPINGVVLTKDIELKAGAMVQPGELMAEVAGLGEWELVIRIDESQIDPLEEVLLRASPANVRFALNARADLTLHAKLSSPESISEMVYREGDRGFVYVTIDGLDLPDELLSVLRPGFFGYAKIDGPERPLLFTLPRRLVDFLRIRVFL